MSRPKLKPLDEQEFGKMFDGATESVFHFFGILAFTQKNELGRLCTLHNIFI